MEIFNSHSLPKNYHRQPYEFNESGRYIKQPQRIGIAKLPEYLKIENTQTNAPKQNGAETVIHGPQKNGRYLYYTGLRETGLLNWQYGNDYEFRKGQKVNSLCLFHWMENDRVLLVYYFTGWYHHDRNKLEVLIRQIIANIQRDETGI